MKRTTTKRRNPSQIAIVGIAIWASMFAVSAGPSTLQAANRPNVVVFVTDDQGYGDLACHGNPIINTPNMDSLHAESIHLTNFHVDPTCSPTRSALMTGRYSHRVKVWHTIMGRNHLHEDEVTMADLFCGQGYRTAHFGKWHLGANYPYRPMDRGFEEWLGQGDGGTGTATDRWGNDRVNDVYLRNGRPEKIDGYTSDVFVDEAIRFLRQSDGDPFFLYLATYVPHSPWSLPDPSWLDPYRGKVPTSTASFYASIERVDRNLGRLRRCLDEEGLAENTIFVFLTDNGTSGGDRIFNAGMRGKKGSEYDGGHRVPCFIHWPKGGLDRPADVSHVTAHVDLLPTLMDLCELEPPKPILSDGTSLRCLLYDPAAAWPNRTLVVESQRISHPEKWRKCSVMTDRWRLVNGRDLYDMRVDPGQKVNVAAEQKEVVDTLRKVYEQFWTEVTRGDDWLARPVLGSPQQDEITLFSEDWVPTQDTSVPWSQAHVADGKSGFGYWPIRVARSGTYRFEVRRWPREAGAPLVSVPKKRKVVDAYADDRPIVGTLYPATPRALPVQYVRIKVGNSTQETKVSAEETNKTFSFDLPAGTTRVEAWLLDEDRRPISSAYYVYVRLAND